MAIIIDMNMPKSCWACRLQVGDTFDKHCAYTGKNTFDNYCTRHKKCPLVEVK